MLSIIHPRELTSVYVIVLYRIILLLLKRGDSVIRCHCCRGKDILMNKKGYQRIKPINGFSIVEYYFHNPSVDVISTSLNCQTVKRLKLKSHSCKKF